MPSLPALVERLPSLYRPELPDAPGGIAEPLVLTFLRGVAAELDAVRDDASSVLPAHWVRQSQRAAVDRWFTLRRERANLPVLAPTDRLDFVDARGFLLGLVDANTPLTRYLREQLPAPVAAALDAWNGRPPLTATLQRGVLTVINRLVRGPSLYEAERFQGIALDPATITRAESELPGLERIALNVQLLLEAFPSGLRRASLDLAWVRELGRLGAIVPLTPWREPPALRETVEAFRIRTARMVALYRGGLGTVQALRTIVEATLPIDATQSAVLRDRPFTVEEFAPLGRTILSAPTNGPPAGLVGPLMRWTVRNPGPEPVAPTLYITGLTPAAETAATVDPMVERIDDTPVAIGFAGTVDPDTTLRLRPAYITWTLGEAGLLRADHDPDAETPADPTTPGEAAAVPGAPPDIVALLRSSDGALWVAAEDGARLSRFDGTTWTDRATGLDPIRCFAERAGDLLIGTADGLLIAPLFPDEGDAGAPTASADFTGVAIRTLVAEGSGLLVGTDTGALHWNGTDTPTSIALGGGAGVTTPVHAIHIDVGGARHFGTDLGVFEHQPARDAWYWYAGDAFTEQSPEWRAFASGPEGTPSDARVFLPAVLDVRRGPDAALWFATSQGIARYIARAVNGGTYTTLLEAFPDLCEGPVTRIDVDPRGGVRFCTERGLLRHDGRDWWQRRGADWVHLGRGDLLTGIVPQPRGGWRFQRSSGQWQRFAGGAGWVTPALELRTTDEPAVTHVQTTDHVSADVGSFDGHTFTATSAIPSGDLFVHVKPTPTRIVRGGLPFLPGLPSGTSHWRYLSREPDDLVEPAAETRPAWSVEGRLFPPPPALDAPYAGRFDIETPPDGRFDQAVYTYDPAARLHFGFEPRQACSVLVRLCRRPGDTPLDPAVLDRVWEGMQLVRPAGIRTRLFTDKTLVRGS